MDDPAKHASTAQKSAAFEWLRKISLGTDDGAEHAAVMMYEVANLRAALEPFADIRAADDAEPMAYTISGSSRLLSFEDATSEAKIREDFERLYLGGNKHTGRRNEHGDYVLPSIQDAWDGWRAAYELTWAAFKREVTKTPNE